MFLSVLNFTFPPSPVGQMPAPAKNFRDVVGARLGQYGLRLSDVCPVDADSAAHRIFSDYGAIFVSKADNVPPPRCIFASETEVAEFQRGLLTATATFGRTTITLRKAAMDGLLAARKEAVEAGLDISPRGGSTASKRTFTETLTLWNSRFLPGLDHWVSLGKISPRDAEATRRSSIPEQIKKVLEWERVGLYFSKDLSKSILYSVAAPGASQHIFMLALDVEQYSDPTVRQILADNGWFQTVKSDMPHFTYLGVKESELPSLGLKKTVVDNQIFWIPNID